MQKIVVNRCYGGFGLSDLAVKMLAIRKGQDYEDNDQAKATLEYFLPRDDADLVAVVEELGDRANGNYAELKVLSVPDGVEWFVEEYDGMEHVAETHRTWR